jgi:hypothetical protein
LGEIEDRLAAKRKAEDAERERRADAAKPYEISVRLRNAIDEFIGLGIEPQVQWLGGSYTSAKISTFRRFRPDAWTLLSDARDQRPQAMVILLREGRLVTPGKSPIITVGFVKNSLQSAEVPHTRDFEEACIESMVRIAERASKESG